MKNSETALRTYLAVSARLGSQARRMLVVCDGCVGACAPRRSGCTSHAICVGEAGWLSIVQDWRNFTLQVYSCLRSEDNLDRVFQLLVGNFVGSFCFIQWKPVRDQCSTIDGASRCESYCDRPIARRISSGELY